MNTAFIIGGVVLVLLTVCTFFAPRGGNRVAPLIAAQAAHVPSPINYGANPYRIGAYVYVMETEAPSDLDWRGTFIGMSNGMALVRDQESHVVAHVNRDQIYGATR